MDKLKAYNERKILCQEEEKMNYKKLTAVFMALGIAATCFSGCGLTEGNGGTSASEPTKAAATAAPKPTKAAAQTGSGSQSGNTGNTSSEAEKEITYINTRICTEWMIADFTMLPSSQ